MKGRPTNICERDRASPNSRPDTAERRVFSWHTDNDSVGYLTVLTLTFHPAGLDVEAGQRLPNHYKAELANTNGHRAHDGIAARGMPFGMTLCRKNIARPTPRALDSFAADALVALFTRYLAGDTQIRSYFACASAHSTP